MSRFKVWKEGITSDEGDILLRLVDCSCYEGVLLNIVGNSGDRISRGSLLNFHKNKAISFAQSVNDSIGLPLDADGELEIDVPLHEIKKTENKDTSRDKLKESIIAELAEKLKGLDEVEVYGRSLNKLREFLKAL